MGPADLLELSVDSIRTRLADLEAELEAGARCADRIHAGTATLDGRVIEHGVRVAEWRALVDRVAELKASIKEQRTLLAELRTSMNQVRRSARELRRGRHPGDG